MTKGPLLGKMLLFALPLAASSVLQLLFNMADVIVVGRFAGSTALAAVGGTTQVINLMVNLFIGLSVGANVVLATLIGQKQDHKLPEMVHTAMGIALVSGVGLLAAGQLLARPVLVLISTPPEVLELAVLYLHIYFLGMPFIMGYNFGAAILRSRGDTRRPLYFLVLSGVLNVLLNLLLVIVFQLSVAGVAIATVLSNLVSFSLIITCLIHEDGPLRLEVRQIRIHPAAARRILSIGIPAGLQSVVFSLANVCIQSGVNSFGAACVAGSSAANNFESLTYTTVNAFGQAAVTFTGQNYGAREYGRCRRVALLAWLASLTVSLTMNSTFYLLRAALLQIYTIDPAVIAYGIQRMSCALRFQFLMTPYEILAGSLRGMGHSSLPAALTVLGTCVLRLVWVYTVFAHWHEFAVLMLAYPVSWVLTSALVLASWLRVGRRTLSGSPAPRAA